MAFFFFVDDRANVSGNVVIAGAFAEQGAEIVIVLAEQAGADFSVGSETDARAVAAERLSDRGDEADFSGGAIGETIFASGLAAFVRNLREGPASVDPRVD